MKINIKPLKGTDFFEVNVASSTTVGELKEKIANEKQKDKGTIKLMHKSKQLNEDNKTLEQMGVKEHDFMILMIFEKVIIIEKKAQKEDKPLNVKVVPTPNITVPPIQLASQATALNNIASQVPLISSQQQQRNEIVSGTQLEEKINEIEDMGFERPKIIQALNAANNNPERAIDYLLQGIIPDVKQGSQMQEEMKHNPDLDSLTQLSQNPQFQQIAATIRQNPNLLQPILAQLSQISPDLARIFSENPQQLLQLLLGASENDGGETLPPNAIQVTFEEKSDIDQIVSMGFDRSDVLEVYISCDKNKEITVNYLFEARENGILTDNINQEENRVAREQALNFYQSNPLNQKDNKDRQ